MTQTQENYSVNLEIFQGPLDLLLYLIRKDEIDIYDIPIARITDQYMHYVEVMKILNLELAGEYILMAATLIRIKARLLLPRDESSDDEQDPREELVAALLEYKKFKEAGEILQEKRSLEERLFVPDGIGTGNNGNRKKVIVSDTTTLFDLLTAFKEVLDRIEEERQYEIEPEETTVEDRMELIRDYLGKVDSATLPELFKDIPTKLIAIMTLLAILEMVRTRQILVRQSFAFSEVRIYRGEFFEGMHTLILKQAEPDEADPAEQV